MSPLAVYIHWPFCKSKCPYCDFNSHVRERIDETRWRQALLAELAWWAEQTEGAAATSIFFGGGTPSLMAPETVAAILNAVRKHWRLAADCEITLEANPTSVEAARFRALRDAGVGRVSLGVQALDAAALKFLGRGHDVREAQAAVEVARTTFPRFSFDLIYARPGQTPAAWARELTAAVAMAGDHLSVYQLTIEAGTAFATSFARRDFALPDEDTAGALYEATQAALEAAGLPAYEISNHARPGQECRHNLAYWRGHDYLGVGPGAHGRLTSGPARFATRQMKAPETWLAAVEERGHGTEEFVRLTPDERRSEMVMMGLRLAEGISRDRFFAATGMNFDQAFGDRLTPLVDGGFVELDEHALRATASGRQRLNALLGNLLA
ncbi:MAG TPA: radical SAM family heme chaperone HemW [Stellaceae bacterium]|nr:radical SAM family heme chaperone HemW [Stellaceae bacterium]